MIHLKANTKTLDEGLRRATVAVSVLSKRIQHLVNMDSEMKRKKAEVIESATEREPDA